MGRSAAFSSAGPLSLGSTLALLRKDMELSANTPRKSSAHSLFPSTLVRGVTILLYLPHLLVDLPRERVASFWRTLLLVGSLVPLYIAFEETRLHLHCSSQREVSGQTIAAEVDAPLWVRLSAHVPDVEPVLQSTESGNFRAAWFPVLSPDDPTTAVAVVRAGDAGAFHSLARGQTAEINGLAYFPRRADASCIHATLSRAGLKSDPGLKVIELGREPAGLLGAAIAALLGGMLLLLGLLRWRLPDLPPSFWSRPASNSRIHTFPDYLNEPLTEDVKIEVRQMVDDVWDVVRH